MTTAVSVKKEKYSSPDALIPKNPLMRIINRKQHLARYCMAIGGDWYAKLCSVSRTKDGAEQNLLDPIAYGDFRAQMEPYILNLYQKYGRIAELYERLPDGAQITLEMVPPSGEEIRRMLDRANLEESKRQN